MLPERRATQEIMAVAIDFAADFSPAEPGWSIAAQLAISEDWLRDVLIGQMIKDRSWDAAVPAMGTLPRDPAMNRDVVIAAALWLGGNSEQALTVARMTKGNKLAGYLGLLIALGADPDEWGRRLVESLTEVRPDPATVSAFKQR